MAYFLLVFLLLSSLTWSEPAPDKEPVGPPKGKDTRVLNPEMRLKLWQLSELPPDQLSGELAQWPHYQKMTPEKRAQLLQRMEELKTSLHQMAAARAKEYGLHIPPGKEDQYDKSFITFELEQEKKLWDEIKPLREKMEATIKDEMVKEYGPTATPPS